MTTKVYADEPWLKVIWDDENQYVHTEWKAFANSKEIRAGGMSGLEAIRENHAIRYLSDARKMKVIVHEDQQWANDTWFRLAAAAGLKRFASVTAESGLGKLTVEEVINTVHTEGLEARRFASIGAARKWLAEI